MNTIQAPNLVLPTASSPTAGIVDKAQKSVLIQNEQATIVTDHYSATAANDAVVARVISSSIDQSFNRTMRTNEYASEPSKLNQRFVSESQSSELLPNFETVTANVVGFVESALANLAQRGFDKEQLGFFKQEAITGVEVGIDQAKLDLIGVVNNETYKNIDSTRQSIIGGIEQLSIQPSEYELTAKETDQAPIHKYTAIEVQNSSNEVLKVNFETRAFEASNKDASAQTYTTSSSNITFALQSTANESSQQDLANLINKIDGLANSFYRGDVQSAYSKSLDLGYTDNEIIGLAKQLNKSDKFQQMKMYGDIQHLDSVRDKADFAAPKTVAEYVNRYLDVIESSNSTLNTQSDFNQVINGIVNQMKDVQVPDVLQAINRFHAFNNQFA